MKILAVSDQIETKFLKDGKGVPHAEEIDLILACGDLPASYLAYLVTVLNVPLFYVLGNHDENILGKHLNGCQLIDEKAVMYKNIIIAGLSGSIQYNEGACMFTEVDMVKKISRLFPRLILNKLRYGRHLDIFISHSPISGIMDEETRTHRGFKALRMFDKYFQPHYHLHGHTLVRDNRYRASYHTTEIININPFRIIDII